MRIINDFEEYYATFCKRYFKTCVNACQQNTSLTIRA